MIDREESYQHSRISHKQRCERLNQKGCTLWFTGLSAAGKSTTAFALENVLSANDRVAYVLDGDNIREGLNVDLAYSKKDRAENVRRISEVAKLFADAGVIIIVSFISPYENDREHARKIHKEADLPFIEVFINASLEVCERRDPKGLYKQARDGEIENFTGIDAPYEIPEHPDLVLNTEEYSVKEDVMTIIEMMIAKNLIKGFDDGWVN